MIPGLQSWSAPLQVLVLLVSLRPGLRQGGIQLAFQPFQTPSKLYFLILEMKKHIFLMLASHYIDWRYTLATF